MIIPLTFFVIAQPYLDSHTRNDPVTCFCRNEGNKHIGGVLVHK